MEEIIPDKLQVEMLRIAVERPSLYHALINYGEVIVFVGKDSSKHRGKTFKVTNFFYSEETETNWGGMIVEIKREMPGRVTERFFPWKQLQAYLK